MTVVGVGGGHADLLMMGLALAGVVLACGVVPGLGAGLPALGAGAAVASIGALIKSPAVIVVAFTPPVWLFASRRAAVREVVAGCATALAAAAATFAALTAATGLGFGWTRQVNADAQWVSWLSLPSAVSMTDKWLTGVDRPRALDATLRACRTVGEVLAVVVLVALWVLAVHRARSTPHGSPAGVLAAALGVAALLAPSVQPWYYVWGLLVAGLAVGRRTVLVALAAVPLMLVLMITPSGYGLESSWPAPVVVLAALLVVVLSLRGEPARRPDDEVDAPTL